MAFAGVQWHVISPLVKTLQLAQPPYAGVGIHRRIPVYAFISCITLSDDSRFRDHHLNRFDSQQLKDSPCTSRFGPS
jgi:hypothetical protein